MSGYRALAGWGNLRRNSGEHEHELPKNGSGAYVAPEELIKDPATYLEQDKWQRFGGGCTISVTVNRNINFHNDIGIRTYTVATTGLLEADFSISGFIAADKLDWLKFAINADPDTTTEPGKIIYHYKNLNGPKTFDIAYIQANSTTNSYAGKNEWHILTGCAVNTLTINYELSSDAGIQFTLDGLALMDYFNLSDDIDFEQFVLDGVPKDVFSTACVSTSDDGSNYEQVAQTDSVSITISNFIERRGNCLTNCASGYSMGTLNVEMDTSTYSNDPEKYLLKLYGHGGAGSTSRIYGVTKTPYAIPYFKVYTDDSDPIGGVEARNKLDFVITDTIASQMQKEYNAENAIMDNPTLRGKDITIKVTVAPTP